MISRPDEVLDASPAKRWTRTLAAIGVFSLALALAAGPAVATTVTFRQGENGYAGAHDTYIQQNPSSAGNNNGALLALNWDGDDPNGTGYDVYTLIRFDDIFGAGAGQIPVGAQITSATLTYLVSNTGGSGDMREVLVAWQDSATYNSFCGGGCAQGNQYGSTVGSASASALAQQSADVTASVQRWSSGTSNYGWFIMNSAADGVDITSSDGATVSDRPILTVRYNEGPPTSHLVREPYLQLGTPTSMTIVWRTDTSTDSRVQYGTTFGTYDHTATSSAVGTDHYVTITGVSPLTKYYYTVGSTTTQQGGGTAEHYFVTSPPVGTSPNGGFTFWIFGDSGICSDIQNQVRDSMLTYTGSDRPELFLHTGDVAQVAGADDEYTNCVLAYYKDVQIHTPFWPAMGNHDSYSSACQDTPCAGACCTGPYFSTWVLPTNAEAGGVASGTEAYYSWDYGNAHFIVLNGTNVSTSSTGAMANWLRTDLAATSQQWVIAYWHQPPYTKGTHDSDTESEPIAMRTNIVPILESYGVDLVLNGHSHGYERSYLIDGAYSTPTPSYSTLLANGNIVDSGSGKTGAEYHKSPGKNPHEGTVYTVVATGGQGPGGAHNHPVMYYSESANGSALVDVKASELDLTFLRSDGTVRDTFTILKGDLPPKVQSASPAKGSVIGSLSSIDVTFNMDVTGVDAGDLTVNGSPATTITPVSTSIYVFGGFAAPASGTVLVTLAAGGIASASSPSNTYGGESWTYTLDTTPPTVKTAVPAAGATIGALPSVTVTFSKPVINVAAGNLVVNGSPAAALSGIAGTDGPYTFSGFTKPDNGLVTVALAAGSIQDNDGRSFGGTSWTYKLTRRLIINEFLSSNNTATTDEYGEFDDYLEIYNPTDAAVDMSGMFLTDNLDSPAQYRIPAGVTVPAHGYIVFWCDSTPSQGARHTNFNIARAGEQLGLFDTEVNGIAAIDTLTFTTQTTDLASGRFPDGQDGFVTMPPTPGAANTINCTGDAECGPLADACNVGRCVSNKCVAVAANEGGACDDGIACVGPDTCAAGICNGGGDQCPSGQTCNRGTGLCETTQLAALPITVGATWRYVKGSSEPTPSDLTAWTRLGYDDASWLQGPGGFGYGVDCTAQRGTTLSDMASSYSSLFMRKAFRVDNPSRVTSLTLTVDYDDAFVAYLNGTEVARNNVVGSPPAYNQLATADHECSACDGTTCNAATTIDLTAYKSLLVAGTNVLAIQAHNLTLASSDFTIVPALASAEVSGCLYDSDCNDNNTCTDDHCDSDSGACSHTNDNANTCSDGVACTTDSCSSGTCVSTDSCLFGQTCNHTTGNCESAPATITFQQDVSGYTGTQDTYLYQSGPDTNEGAALTWRWDTDDPGSSGLWEYGLIRFDGIFGNGAGQIPAGSTINSATLSLYVENGSVAPVGTINEVLAEWSEATTTWNNFGGEAGVQADEYGTLVGNAPIATGSVAIDVTASLRTWVASPAANLGWIFRPNNTDGMAVTSSEGATTANRPKLTVQFVPPGTSCTGDPDCDDGLFCNGQERCVSLFCQAGTAVDCSDGVACTTDSCNEAANACDHLANNAACDDGDVCTDDTCSPALGCQHGSNTAACNDGNACTTTDTCSGGTCVGSGSLTCNDGIACTTDTCVSPSGCQYVDTCTGGRVCNHTSGVCETPSVEPLPIESGDTWKYFKGLSEPTPTDLTAWTRIGFDDSAWLQGPTGIGYDYYVETGGTNGNGDYGPYIRAELGDMRSCTPTNPPLCNSPGYLSVYMRKAFAVANPAAVASLSFRMYADDGYVAYLNGTEVARIRMTGTPPLYNAVATGGPSVAPPVEQTLDLTSFKGLLATGTNVLAVQGHNAALDSRDLLMIPQLSSTQIQGCTSDAECNDGNPCTDDVCNLGTGVCSNTPDNTNICSDGIACTSDVCLGGVCTSSDTCPTGQTCNHTSGVCDLAPVTATFQQGDANGYSGTVDTYTYAANPTTSYATDVLLTTDFTPPTTDERQILIRFDGIFGSGANQIPPGSTIRSATLTVNVSNAFGTNDYVRFNRMKATWNATETWNSFGASPWNSTAGVQADDVEAVADADVTVNNIPTGLQSIAVTPSLQAWSASPASNFGWVLRSGYADSLAFDSSDVTTIANRPKLSVTYTAPSGPQARMACALESGTAAPGTTVSLTAFLENLGFLGGIRGYQTQLQIIRTSGSGTVGVPCPSGVSVDDGRSDYLFYGLSNDYPVTNCALMRAASALQQGSVTVGTTTPAYLSSYTLGVGSDVALGSTFEFTFAPYPDSALADANADPVSFETGPACVLTVGGCGSNTQCDDDNPCTDDVCNGGVCQNTPNSANACDDGNACTTGDHCDASGACIGGPLLTCDDGNVCTDDSCNQTTGCVHANNTLPCDDGTVCNGHEVCGGGTCNAGTPLNCNDGNVCTTDSCDSVGGCQHANNTLPCDDGTVCNGHEVCGGGTCNSGTPLNCDDGNVCTDDACDTVSGCGHVNNTAPCDDATVCNGHEVCNSGSCQAGVPLNCNDGNVCTDDSCDAVSGCGHLNNTAPCDDSTVCNGREVCGGGTCHAGTPPNCDDGNVCTTDSCDVVSGCRHVSAAPCNFTPGDVVIYRVGSGSGSLVSTGNPVFLDEYTPTGMLVQSIPMPTADALPNRAFYASGTAGSEGMLTRSADGRYLVLTGYASTYTSSLAGTSGTLVNRVIGRVDVTSAIDTTTALTDFASGNNPRSATSDNGARFWAAGAAGGVRYAALGASTSTDLTSASLANARQVSLFAGQLYTSSDRANFKGVNAIGTGLPTTPSQPVVRLFGLTDATSPSGYSYFFADLTDAVPGFDTLYIADDSSNATGGVQKYSLVGGTWVANGSVEGASNAYRGLVGKVNGTTTTLYATRKGGSGATGGGELVSLVDATGYNATITATSSIIAAAAANTSFRGVAFAPELCGNVVCTPLDQCHDAGVCNPATGACSNPVKADGAGCSDGNACTVNDSCTAGVCGGTSYSCDDSNPCTVDSCNGDGTCTNSPYSCDDSNACTIDACNGDGTCTNTPHSCDDSNPCTDDSCNGDGSCTHTPRVPCGFTPGDVVIYRVGSGTGSLVNTGNPVFLDEFTPGGMLVQSVPMPIADALPNRAFYASGTASSEGMLTRSADGRYLVLTGYASTSTSSLSGTSGTTVNRVIGRVNAASAINTSTALTDFASGNNPRSATSDNGARFWASGGAGGVRYAALGASTSIDLTSAILANARQVSIFAGQLYGSSDRTNFKGVNAIGAGLPTTPSQPVVRLPGLTDTTSPSSFSYFFADLTDSVTGFDTLYIADDSNSATGGVQKYSLVGGTWVANGSVEGSGNTYRGLVGKVDGTTVTIYATRKGGGGATGGGELVSLVDATGYNVTITATSTVLATAAASTAFRGVAFAPEGIDLCAGVVCTALDQCHDTGVCDPATGICSDPLKPSGAACDDGDACTAGETCDSGGVCRGGAAIDCNDLDVCTTDTCSGGQCLHVPSGSCGVGGTVWYYRNSVTDSEPSAKGTPNVGIDVTGDLVAEATTGGGGGGGYSILNLAGNTTVRTLNKFGSPRASDHNDAVGSYDAAAISRYVVGLQSLSGNQLIAGDVTGNGQVTSYDAAKVAQFGVELIDHFDVAAATGSDWKFLRCDVYGSAVDQNCGPAAYPAPLTGMATDNFYAVLYGDVTGNWEAATAYARSTSAESEAEAAAADDDRRMAAELRPMAGRILGRPEGMPGAVLTVGNLPRVAGAGSRVEIGLDLRNADGIEALDLRLLYDPDRIRVVDVRTGGLAPQFKLATGDSGGDRRIGMYGVLPLQGSGRLLTVTVEVLKSGRLSRQFSIEASANEGRIPLRVRGGATAGKP